MYFIQKSNRKPELHKNIQAFFMALLLNFPIKTNYICLKPKTMNKITFCLLLLVITSACGIKNAKNFITEGDYDAAV